MTVTVGGHKALRRWLNTYVVAVRSRRIYEESDAFVNYCINRSRPIYSYHHRLYCVRPGRITRGALFSKRRPR